MGAVISMSEEFLEEPMPGEEDMNPDERAIAHILRQAALGEFSPHHEQARLLSAELFAHLHHTTVHPWGRGDFYKCVTVDGVDYLWIRSTGQYDGWDVDMTKP
jgi:hypothetical protein